MKEELIERVHAMSGLDKRQVRIVFDVLAEVVVDMLKNGREVGLPGIGRFVFSRIKERDVVIPSTGEEVSCPAKTVIKFKVKRSIKAISFPLAFSEKPANEMVDDDEA